MGLSGHKIGSLKLANQPSDEELVIIPMQCTFLIPCSRVIIASSPVWLGGSILVFYILAKYFMIKADVSAPIQVPSSVQ